jgi:Domain of unknown function (DUF1707)
MASGNEMRVGDAEREATAAELREHYASGRLTLDELNERLDKAFAAKTRSDLDALMRDLPSARAGAGGQSGGPGWSAGASGPGAGWSGPSGPGSGWSGPGSSWTGPGGAGWGAATGRRACGGVGSMVATFVVMCALLVTGILAVSDMGAGRPIGIVLILAALALLRRLVFRRVIRGGRGGRGGRTRGPRRRRW